jgi:rhamnosyltransferase
MAESGWVQQVEPRLHAVVIPFFGRASPDWTDYLHALEGLGFLVVVVDNNPEPMQELLPGKGCVYLLNRNQGGIAGGLNRGIHSACQMGVTWITLLDQDSRISPRQICRLRAPFDSDPARLLLIGPSIWDEQRQRRHGRWSSSTYPLQKTRLLISSGTTFRSADWNSLGALHEGLFIDFVDHAWCFRAQVRGFQLFQHAEVTLKQQFGVEHPSWLCRSLGLQLYSPARHFYGLRNLRWLCLQTYIPLDLKVKEVLKMLIKPWLWVLFEPQRRANLKAITAGLFAPLPGRD